MPDAKGNLTEEDRQKAKLWFEQHWKENTVCSICKGNNWIVSSFVVVTSASLVGGKTYSMVPLICGVCGHTLFFNAILMGLLPPGGVQNLNVEPER